MNISLTPAMETWIENKVKSGLYQTSSEVVREMIRDYITQDEARTERKKELLALLEEADQDIAAGRVSPLTPNTIEEIKALARTRRVKP
jgi:antitoxin ParD1/3/4